MAILTLPIIKSYLRLDTDHVIEDDLLTLMADNAEEYLKNSISRFDEKIVDPAFKKKAELAALVLVSDFYENRTLMSTKVSEKVRKSVRSIILQMEFSFGSDISGSI